MNPAPQPGAFHGQGSPETDDAKQSIAQYFHQVDHGVREILQDQRAPLVLAGVNYLLPIYQEANHYPQLVQKGLTGNPELLKPEELYDQAWTIVEPYFLKARQEAAERYRKLLGTGQASNSLKEIVPAALYGRVESLFVATGAHQWGIFNPGTNDIQLHADEEAGDEDLLDFAAVHTVLNSGNVYAVEPEQVPDQALVTGVFRY